MNPGQWSWPPGAQECPSPRLSTALSGKRCSPAPGDIPPGGRGPSPSMALWPSPALPALGLVHLLALMTPTATMTRAQKQLAPTPASTTSRAMRASRLRPRLHSQYVPAAETGPVRPRGPCQPPVEDAQGRPSPWGHHKGTGGALAGGGRGTGGGTCSRDEQKGQTYQAKGAADRAGVRLGTGGHVQPPAPPHTSGWNSSEGADLTVGL